MRNREKKCINDDCNNKVYSKGMCKPCYEKNIRNIHKENVEKLEKYKKIWKILRAKALRDANDWLYSEMDRLEANENL